MEEELAKEVTSETQAEKSHEDGVVTFFRNVYDLYHKTRLVMLEDNWAPFSWLLPRGSPGA